MTTMNISNLTPSIVQALQAQMDAAKIRYESTTVAPQGSMMASAAYLNRHGGVSSVGRDYEIQPQPRATKITDLFTDEEADSLLLVAQVLEDRGIAAPEHFTRMRKVATTIRVLLSGSPR